MVPPFGSLYSPDPPVWAFFKGCQLEKPQLQTFPSAVLVQAAFQDFRPGPGGLEFGVFTVRHRVLKVQGLVRGK